jgi:very-short-patch-repair endonuclease
MRLGRLYRIHRGVFAVGHPVLAPLAAETAALLACAGSAVLSHMTAARLWGLPVPKEKRIHLIVDRGRAMARSGICAHRIGPLGPGEVGRRSRLPLTTPTRTLLDIAALIDGRGFERAFEAALTQRMTTRATIARALERAPTRRGSAQVRAILRREVEPALTRSEAEERFLALVRRAGLPPPRVNARVGAYEVDFLWAQQRLIVEIDGFAFHSTRSAFERDRRRDSDLQAAGYRVMRLTWRQIIDEPEAVLVRVAQALVASERARPLAMAAIDA